MKLTFVGDTPSRLNISPNVPFLGTRSYTVLRKWLTVFDTASLITFTNSSPNELSNLDKTSKIIALGNKASVRLTKLNIQHFKLPHPSPRNRQLNDIDFISRKLADCRDWITND